MKVICINDRWVKSPEEKGKPHPFFGEECFVIDYKEFCGKLFYQLGGRFNKSSGFLADNFIPLSDIDETELVNQREEECIS